MSQLRVSDLHASVDGHEILRGVELEIASGEVHAVMGPNGSGKSTLSHVLMGRADYTVTQGSVTIDGTELLGLEPYQRAARGLFLAMQYPVEVPGVRVGDLLDAALRGQSRDGAGLPQRIEDEAARLGVDERFLRRGVNVEFSGGEQKTRRDVAACRVAPTVRGARRDRQRPRRRRAARRRPPRRGHDHRGRARRARDHALPRLLTELRPDRVHVLMSGRIVASGGPELADHLEQSGYEGLARELGLEAAVSIEEQPDPFADPGF